MPSMFMPLSFVVVLIAFVQPVHVYVWLAKGAPAKSDRQER